jgi:hypothetical protein
MRLHVLVEDSKPNTYKDMAMFATLASACRGMTKYFSDRNTHTDHNKHYNEPPYVFLNYKGTFDVIKVGVPTSLNTEGKLLLIYM